MTDSESDGKVYFTINGKSYQADPNNVEITTTLNTFIRDVANLKGTKYMCREGGCGTCVVSMTAPEPTGKKRTFAINSCLVPVLSCHGLSITTIEGIGDQVRGYHPIQRALAVYNGTQCGYCSPGQIMNMYSLLKRTPRVTKKEVENAFGSNICRCTGYRSILDAFKSFASDAPTPPSLAADISDIEDLDKKCSLQGERCHKKCVDCPQGETDSSGDEEDFVKIALADTQLKLSWRGLSHWFRVTTISEIFQVFDAIGSTSYRLVAGNTAQGVYRDPNPQIFIDINPVSELRTFEVYPEHVEVGANLTLSDFISNLKKTAVEHYLMFGYMKQIASHIELVAHIPVRNIGTIAGNLSIKHQHWEFPSDIFLLMETSGSSLVIRDKIGLDKTVSPAEYLQLDMWQSVIVKIIMPALSSEHYLFRTYKIMPRSQNVHALVNAGFLFKTNVSSNWLVEERPNIVYGAINPEFIHAQHTESFWQGKSLLSQKRLRTALTLLLAEIKPDFEPSEASQQFRQLLAINLFYRFVLSVDVDAVHPSVRSGGLNLKRPLSSGIQVWDINKAQWPVHQPITKLEAFIQNAGEAQYVDDIPMIPGELHGALVITSRASTTLVSVDPSKALAWRGVVAYIGAADVPGINTFIGVNEFNMTDEELFCSGRVLYAGQPIGMIVAISQSTADTAARLVEVKYGSSTKPILTIEDALQSKDRTRVQLIETTEPTQRGSDVAIVIKGSQRMEGQYHYTMELQTSFVVPVDDGSYKVYSSTQWSRHNQAAISRALKIPMSSIDVEVRRCGGAFGSRITKSAVVSTACAVAAHKLRRPVRMVLDMETNFKSLSHRYPNLINYEVGVNKVGKIQYLNADFYENYGCSRNDDVQITLRDSFRSCYDFSSFRARFFAVLTDLPSTTWMRAPGTLEGLSMIEQVMEHIADVTGLDSTDVRTANLSNEHRAAILEITSIVKQTSNYDKRIDTVDKNNKENRWKKRGMALVPMNFTMPYFPNFNAFVSIYGDDGTVAITTGGVEVGQGINTKIAQVAAYTLGIHIKFIRVKPSMSITSPNNFPTGNSIATDCATYATMRCCQTILDRLKQLRAKMPTAPWVTLTKAAVQSGIKLSASYMYSLTDPIPQRTNIYGVTALEVEVDILTGQYQILRADILEDCGESLNPLLDVGQVEGAFVMGLGYYSSEELKRDPNTGELLTYRTWTYWPPGAKDIPADFRVLFRRNSKNPVGVLGSKATGEPPLCMTMVLQHALRHALKSARKDAGLNDEWFDFHQPCTFEKTLLTSGTNPKQFSL